jgi:hypothetical protein
VAGRSYRVEVFLPRQNSAGSLPRTTHAVYQIAEPGLTGVPVRSIAISQRVSESGWVSLGTFSFLSRFQVTLTDATGEPAGTRSVVADAVRLIPVTVGSP